MKIDPAALRMKLHQDPAEIRQLCEALLDQAGVTLPEDYDIESAFAEVLSLGIMLGDHKDAQQPIARLALWMFRRLPGTPGGV